MDLTDPRYESLIEHLISLCLSAVEIVADVVNSDSPEGHLPGNTKVISDHQCDSDVKSESVINVMNCENDRTSQLVLLCSWRTVKDACLLLGDICTRCANLPEEKVVKLSKHLVTQLSEITHRFGHCHLFLKGGVIGHSHFIIIHPPFFRTLHYINQVLVSATKHNTKPKLLQ